MIKFCSLYSGSSGNCLFVSDGKTKILIDAGLSGIRIIEALNSIGENPSELSAILVTHEHSDHTKGVGIVSRKFCVPIYANLGTFEGMKRELKKIPDSNLKAFNTGVEFMIGEIGVRPFQIPHDANDPVGYSFFIDGKKITIATDIGHMNKTLLCELENSDAILLESNHDIQMLKVGPYPYPLKQRILGQNGHLSNEMAGKVVAYLAEKGTRCFMLGHLSKENNFPELAYQTSLNALTEKGIAIGSDVSLEVVLRDRVGSILELD